MTDAVWPVRALGVGIALLAFVAGPAHGRLTKIHIASREMVSPARAGERRYEILRGTFEGQLDPGDPYNAIITDLAGAPRNAAGLVDYSATFEIARPLGVGNFLS